MVSTKNKSKEPLCYLIVKPPIWAEKGLKHRIEFAPFNDDLHYLQKLVGGHIEHFNIADELYQQRIDLWIDEEGKIKHPNDPVTFALFDQKGEYLIDYIIGNCVFSKFDDEGNTLGLTVPETKRIYDWLSRLDVVRMKDTNTGNEFLAYQVNGFEPIGRQAIA